MSHSGPVLWAEFTGASLRTCLPVGRDPAFRDGVLSSVRIWASMGTPWGPNRPCVATDSHGLRSGDVVLELAGTGLKLMDGRGCDRPFGGVGDDADP